MALRRMTALPHITAQAANAGGRNVRTQPKLALTWPPKLERSRGPVSKTGRDDELKPHDQRTAYGKPNEQS